jgi:cytochrome c oxidase cbb3-type subunit 1
MPTRTSRPEPAGHSTALRQALGWLVFGNLVGLYLSVLLLFPELQLAHWTYGRWVPVHLNVQLYGWTSLPLVAWLFSIYQVESSKARAWAPAAVWAWTAALALGVLHWLGGVTSGKIFLDWKGGALWGFFVAQVILWLVLAAAWRERSHDWNKIRRFVSLVGLVGLAMVPVSLAFAASPAVYPPVDRTTGGPTGSSLLGSSLIVVGLMLLLPRIGRPRAGRDRPPGGPCEWQEDDRSWNADTACHEPYASSLHSPDRCGKRSLPVRKQSRGIWMFFALSWLVFGVTEAMGGTHFQAVQIGAMLFLLPWVWWIPRDWAGFDWPEGSRVWRVAMLGWWGVLVVSGLLMYQPGVLDHLKFTQGLVAHTHLAMAGFTTSFCALLLVLLTGRRIGSGWSVVVWHGAALAMIVVLAVMGWKEGDGPSWMLGNAAWREWGLVIRAACGLLMLSVSVIWLIERRTT